MQTEEQRSKAQNRALHKLFGDISAYCVESGIDQRTVVNRLENFQCPTSPQFVKETWRAMQVAITGKHSTTELTRTEIDQVFEAFNKFWSEMTGEHFMFPSVEAMMFAQLEDENR